MVLVDRLRRAGLRATALCAALAVCITAFDGAADAQGGNPGPPLSQPSKVRIEPISPAMQKNPMPLPETAVLPKRRLRGAE